MIDTGQVVDKVAFQMCFLIVLLSIDASTQKLSFFLEKIEYNEIENLSVKVLLSRKKKVLE